MSALESLSPSHKGNAESTGDMHGSNLRNTYTSNNNNPNKERIGAESDSSLHPANTISMVLTIKQEPETPWDTANSGDHLMSNDVDMTASSLQDGGHVLHQVADAGTVIPNRMSNGDVTEVSTAHLVIGQITGWDKELGTNSEGHFTNANNFTVTSNHNADSVTGMVDHVDGIQSGVVDERSGETEQTAHVNSEEIDEPLGSLALDPSSLNPETTANKDLVKSPAGKKNAAKSFVCMICNRSIANKANLIIHMRIHTGEKPYKCPTCDKGFASKPSCDAHLISHVTEKSRKCSYCGMLFKRQESLAKHEQVVHKGVTFTCPVCGKVVTRAANLRTHMRIHAGLKPFKCTVCGQTFARTHHLKYHMMTHTQEKPHKCVTCGRAFARATGLTSHIRTHTGEKPFSCEVCQKDFALAADLKNHVRIHTGEKPFKCEACGKCFGRRANLSAHRKSHRTDMPYKCAICDQRFKQPVSRSHIANHTGEPIVKNFTCPDCSKAFTTACNLLSHMKYIHTNERDYRCTECDRQFVAKAELARHARIHSGIRPFMCPICGKTFNREHHFHKHRAVMHSNVSSEQNEVIDDNTVDRETKRYRCIYCNKLFPTSRGVKIHTKKIHTKKERLIIEENIEFESDIKTENPESMDDNMENRNLTTKEQFPTVEDHMAMEAPVLTESIAKETPVKTEFAIKQEIP